MKRNERIIRHAGGALFLATLLLLMNGSYRPAMADVRELVAAAEINDVSAVEQLLDGGVPVDGRDSRGRTALLAATHANAIDAARTLIGRGADVNARDHIDDSPYLYAAAEGRVEILKMTLDAGADLASTNRYGGTGLIPAAHHGYPEVVRMLLDTEIDVDHVNDLGWTALLEAVILGDGGPVHQEIVRLLLEGGADPAIADRQGRTPLNHARSRGQTAIVRILEESAAR